MHSSYHFCEQLVYLSFHELLPQLVHSLLLGFQGTGLRFVTRNNGALRNNGGNLVVRLVLLPASCFCCSSTTPPTGPCEVCSRATVKASARSWIPSLWIITT